MTSSKRFQLYQKFFPVESAQEEGLYFYQQPITELRGGRVLVEGHGEMLMLSSYSYLGLLDDPRVKSAASEAAKRFGASTHGVRLLAGTTSLHEELEEKIAEVKQTQDSIVFSNGYITNVSTIAALLEPGDTAICDRFDHASIMDGCRLSGAETLRFKHNDLSDLERCLKSANTQRNTLVIVDGVFSMDGDIADVPGISQLCREYGAWLMVDEAHSIGVLGEKGSGIESHFDLPPDAVDVKMGTLSKAIPSVGGYVAGSAEMISMLKHRAKGFIFSAALGPPQAAAALAAFKILDEEPERPQELLKQARYFRDCLQQIGANTLSTETPIVPVICGDDALAYKVSKFCQDRGLFQQGVAYPVVPKGLARLRCNVLANHTREDLDYCVEVIEDALRQTGVL